MYAKSSPYKSGLKISVAQIFGQIWPFLCMPAWSGATKSLVANMMRQRAYHATHGKYMQMPFSFIFQTDTDTDTPDTDTNTDTDTDTNTD